jgi:hypothetical protein
VLHIWSTNKEAVMKNAVSSILSVFFFCTLLGCSNGDPGTSKEYTKVQSALFKSANYDSKKGKLVVTFMDDKVHTYSTVTPEIGEAFISASSPDKIYNQKIKSYFLFKSSDPSENK